jgi:cytochrome d ubiquinol oxidase subunit II
MLTAYAVLVGFDLGAGVIHWLVARTDEERQIVLRAIRPVWDGNEVWLIAAGGTLFFAFPALYASSFSGFYLSLHIVLWLLMLRAIGIEFRGHLSAPVWRDFFDGLFSLSSALLAIVFGAALGNVIRGVPLQADGSFFEPLWTNFRVGQNNGILDWYTVLCALLVLCALTFHGAAYLQMKTSGAVHTRASLTTAAVLGLLILVSVIALFATFVVRPDVLTNYRAHPAGFAIPVIAVASALAMIYTLVAGRERDLFLASCGYLAAMLAGVAFALYPQVLPASTGKGLSLTIYNTAAGAHSLTRGIYWWGAGMLLAVTYVVVVYRAFRGRVA